MPIGLRTSLVVTLATVGGLCAAGLSGCSTSRETSQPAASAQDIPRTSDGKPDFTGVWAGPGFRHTGKDTDNATVRLYTDAKMAPMKPDGKSLFYKPHTGNVRIDDPTAVCLPNGLTRQIPSPYAQQFIQTADQLVVLYEYMHFFRVIPTDGRPHQKDVEQTWMGDSVAKWEGDTLVIDSIGLKEWMLDATHDSKPDQLRIHSDQIHVTERLRYVDPTTVSYQVTIDDPKIFTAPWSQDFEMKLHPTWKIFEFVCEENNRCIFGKCTEADVQKTSRE
jgi:hypothetical protein